MSDWRKKMGEDYKADRKQQKLVSAISKKRKEVSKIDESQSKDQSGKLNWEYIHKKREDTEKIKGKEKEEKTKLKQMRKKKNLGRKSAS